MLCVRVPYKMDLIIDKCVTEIELNVVVLVVIVK